MFRSRSVLKQSSFAISDLMLSLYIFIEPCNLDIVSFIASLDTLSI